MKTFNNVSEAISFIEDLIFYNQRVGEVKILQSYFENFEDSDLNYIFNEIKETYNNENLFILETFDSEGKLEAFIIKFDCFEEDMFDTENNLFLTYDEKEKKWKKVDLNQIKILKEKVNISPLENKENIKNMCIDDNYRKIHIISINWGKSCNLIIRCIDLATGLPFFFSVFNGNRYKTKTEDFDFKEYMKNFDETDENFLEILFGFTKNNFLAPLEVRKG